MALTYTNPHEQSLIALRQELARRLNEEEEAKQRIIWLRNSITALEPLANNPPPQPHGNLSQVLCAVLSANPGRPMTVCQIRQTMDAMGIKFQKPANAAAVVNVTLRRLAAKPNSGVKIEALTPLSASMTVSSRPHAERSN